MTATLPIRFHADLRSVLVAGLAVLALLVGGLALHTSSGAHREHATTVGLTASAPAVMASALHHASTTPGTTAAGTPNRAGPVPGATITTGAAVAGAVLASAAGAVDHGLGSDLLATCALLLALAGAVVLFLAGRARQGRDPSDSRCSSHPGIVRWSILRTLYPTGHRPDLTALSISRR